MGYEKHPLEDLSEDELKEISLYEYEFTEETKMKIYDKFNDKTKAKQKNYINKVVVSVIMIAMFGTVVFANADRISALYNRYFSTDANIEQYAEIIEKSYTDEDIKMEILTAINDGDSTYLFVDLKDEIGNRLTDDIFIDRWDLFGEEMEYGGGNCRLVEFDKNTGVATLAVHSIGSKPGKKATFTLKSFFTDKTDFSTEVGDINLKEIASNTFKFVEIDKSQGFGGGVSKKFEDDGKEIQDVENVLEEDAINIKIKGYEKGHLSNIGYKDGYLHIQMMHYREKGNEALSVLLKNKNTGEQLFPYYSIGYGEGYQEFVFEIETLEDLNNYNLLIEGFYFKNIIEGIWDVSFIVPEQMNHISIKTNESILVNDEVCKITDLTISPLSVSMNVSNFKKDGKLEVNLVYEDGTKRNLETEMLAHMSDEESNIRINTVIMNLEQLKGIEINGTYFSVD